MEIAILEKKNERFSCAVAVTICVSVFYRSISAELFVSHWCKKHRSEIYEVAVKTLHCQKDMALILCCPCLLFATLKYALS